jgi:hypothetical protein
VILPKTSHDTITSSAVVCASKLDSNTVLGPDSPRIENPVLLLLFWLFARDVPRMVMEAGRCSLLPKRSEAGRCLLLPRRSVMEDELEDELIRLSIAGFLFAKLKRLLILVLPGDGCCVVKGTFFVMRICEGSARLLPWLLLTVFVKPFPPLYHKIETSLQ